MRLWTWFQCEFLDQSIVPDIKTAIAKGQGKIHRTLLWPTKIHRQIMVRFSIAIIICKLPPKIRKGLETIQIRRTITDRGVRRNTGKKLECCELVKVGICGTLIGFFLSELLELHRLHLIKQKMEYTKCIPIGHSKTDKRRKRNAKE